MSAATAFSLPKAELIALFLESLLFGAFAVLYFISIWILMYREHHHGRTRLNKWMLATATTMFILGIAHLCFDLQRAIDGFISHGGTPDGTNAFYSRLNNPTHVGKSVIYITQTLVGDSFVTYRMFIVFNRNPWILILPLSLVAGTAIAGYGICVVLTQLKGGGAIFEGGLVPWITSFFALSLTTNVIATLLISGRIMWSNYKVRRYRAGYGALSHSGVIETIVQSAAIYSAALISLLATYVSGSNAQYICLDSLQPIIGITFTLIIIRVGLNETASEHSKGHIVDSRVVPTHNVHQIHGAQQYPMRPLAINVSVSRTHDRASFEGYDQKEVTVSSDKEFDIESGSGGSP